MTISFQEKQRLIFRHDFSNTPVTVLCHNSLTKNKKKKTFKSLTKHAKSLFSPVTCILSKDLNYVMTIQLATCNIWHGNQILCASSQKSKPITIVSSEKPNPGQILYHYKSSCKNSPQNFCTWRKFRTKYKDQNQILLIQNKWSITSTLWYNCSQQTSQFLHTYYIQVQSHSSTANSTFTLWWLLSQVHNTATHTNLGKKNEIIIRASDTSIFMVIQTKIRWKFFFFLSQWFKILLILKTAINTINFTRGTG